MFGEFAAKCEGKVARQRGGSNFDLLCFYDIKAMFTVDAVLTLQRSTGFGEANGSNLHTIQTRLVTVTLRCERSPSWFNKTTFYCTYCTRSCR